MFLQSRAIVKPTPECGSDFYLEPLLFLIMAKIHHSSGFKW